MKWIITGLILLVLLPLVMQTKKPAHAMQINNSTTGKSVEKSPEITKQPSREQDKAEVANQAPLPEQSTVVVQSQNPKDIAKLTLNDLGLGDSWYAVDFIVSHESSWNPTVLNSIGACGLFQALPCSKLPCELPDVACQVRWATNYANQRYGSWHNAYNFWIKNRYW